MDLVVIPAEMGGAEWRLQDRLGRPLGQISKAMWPDDPFTIVPKPGGRLDGVPIFHPSLDAALSAIEQRLGGTCELVSGPKD